MLTRSRLRAFATGPLGLLLAGIAAVGIGTFLGTTGSMLEAIVSPPILVRAALVGAATVVAIACLARAASLPGRTGSTIRRAERRDSGLTPA
jgi:hypothetical protein